MCPRTHPSRQGDGWTGGHPAALWRFENRHIKDNFFPAWNTQNIDYQIESTTFTEVNFPDLESRTEVGSLAQSEVLVMKISRFVFCSLPLSVLVTTVNGVFERCTFREDAAGFAPAKSLSVKVYARDTTNKVHNLPPPLNLQIRDFAEFRGRAGARDR